MRDPEIPAPSDPRPLRGRLLDLSFGGCACHGRVEVRFAAGAVASVAPAPGVAAEGGATAEQDAVAGRGDASDTLLMTPFANAHDHVRGVRPLALGAFDLPLELWLTAMTRVPPVDPYLVAGAALGRQALGGVGTIMIHYTRPRDPARLADEMEVVARAARDVGVRVAVAVAMRDANPLGYGPDARVLEGLEPADRALLRERLVGAPAGPAEQVRLVEEIAERVEGEGVSVQFGPYGLEWCSEPLLRAIAERSATTGRRVHMHLLESPLQREYLDHVHAGAPVAHLDAIGLLSPRLSVAHAVWLRPDEMDLLAARGVTVSTNASSNLALRSGPAPVAEMHRRGVPLAMGLDGFSLDDDDDAFRELRLNHMLHKGVGLADGIGIGDLLRAACEGGRASVSGITGGAPLAGGAPGDLMALDLAPVSGDLVTPVEAAALVVHRGTKRLLRRMVVGGRDVVRDGALTRVDLPGLEAELNAQARHGAPDYASWREVSDRLGARLRAYYGAGLHRCG